MRNAVLMSTRERASESASQLLTSLFTLRHDISIDVHGTANEEVKRGTKIIDYVKGRCCPQRNGPTRRRLTSFQMATSILSTTEEANEIHDTSFLSIMKFDSDIRKDSYADDVLHHHVPSDRRAHDHGVHCVGTIYDEIKVVAPPARRYAVRIGGSILSTLSTFQQMWTSKGKYDKSGLPRAHNADHVRDVQRARNAHGDSGRFVSVCFKTHHGHRNGSGDSGRFVSVCFKTHNGHRDGFLRRCVAHSSNLRGVSLQQNRTLHVIKMDLVKKCREMPAETAEKNEYIESYGQSGKCLKLENHDDSTIRAQIAELLELNTSKSEDEQFSLKEGVC